MSAGAKFYVVMVCFLAMPMGVGCGSSANTGSGTSMDAMADALDAQKSSQQQDQAQTDAERAAQERSKRRPSRSRSDKSRAAKAWHRADITRPSSGHGGTFSIRSRAWHGFKACSIFRRPMAGYPKTTRSS